MEYIQIQGEHLPKLGFGTWQMTGESAYRAVLNALELGYRHIDTAEMYRNEREVGRALTNSGVERDEVFLVTKVWSSQLAYEAVLASGRGSVERLGVDAVDLLLIHWPNDIYPIAETMRALNELVQEGVCRRIGVSNFSVPELIEAQAASEEAVFTNQVRYHVGYSQDALLRYCEDAGVLVTAYSPLGKGGLATDLTLSQVGAAHGKTAAQVALRWLIQQPNVVTIPKSIKPDRQRENLDIFDFELTEAEMSELGAR